MDKAKKKQIKKAVTWTLLAALVAGLAAMPLLAKAEADADGPVASILSGTVETGSITTAIHGGGTLSSEDVEDIKLPTGVKITEFLVKNDTHVTAGTPLAAVDPVSVMTAITEVTDTMEYLQKEIRNSSEEKVKSTVSATAGGRIKQVFARQGDRVQDVMLEHGALAVLSLDGLMAVKIQQNMELPTGSSVTVTFDDGTEAEGRVDSNLDGTIVVTLEDDGYAIGDTVTVTAENGEEVGSGELYVHNAWSATAFSGTIQTVWAKEEAKVSSGASLFSLTDTDFKATLEYMSSLHREYEDLLQDLFKMYRSGTIDAPCDGIVSGVDEDSVHLLSAGDEGEYEAALLNNTPAEEKGWTLVLLTNVVMDEPIVSTCNPELGENCPAEENHDPKCLKACQKNTTCSATGQHYPECIHSCILSEGSNDCGRDPEKCYHKDECIKSCVHSSIAEQCKDAKYPHYLDCIESCIDDDGTKGCPSLKHKLSCIKACTHAGTPDACSATTHHYLDCIKACITSDSSSKPCPASKHHTSCFFASMTYKAWVALVDQVGTSDLVIRQESGRRQYDVIKTGSGWAFANPGDYNPALLTYQGSLSVANPSAYKAGDVILVITGYKGNSPQWSGMAVYASMAAGGDQTVIPGIGDLSGLMGNFAGLLGGFGNFGFSAASPVEENKLFDLEGSVLLTVSPESTASLTITLDEQDISKVSAGQKATVKVQALSGQVFDAEVVEVANRGVNSGGSSKFTAKLRLPKTGDMIDGMSATASLELQTKEDIPCIPVAALAQQGAQTVVFTALDKETGEPANPVPVTLGISDGIHAEILEGLKPGDSYYYSYYDTLELDTGVEDRFTLR